MIQAPSNPIGHERSSASVEHFWNSKDNILMSPAYDWSTPDNGMKIFVTCDDDTNEAGDDVDNNLEDLCLAVTEQALN